MLMEKHLILMTAKQMINLFLDSSCTIPLNWINVNTINQMDIFMPQTLK